MKSRPIYLHALRVRTRPEHSFLRFFPPAALRPFSATPRYLNTNPNPDPQQPPNPKDKEKQKETPNRNVNDGPIQSPWKAFINVFREEIQKNKEWQDNVKSLGGEVDKLADSAALKRSREIYERARLTNLIKNNPRLQASAAELARQGVNMHDLLSRTLSDSVVIERLRQSYGWSAARTAELHETLKRNSRLYGATAATLEEVVDDLDLGGYEERAERRARRERRAEKAGKTGVKRVKANPEAGEALVLSDKPTSTPRSSFLSSSPTMQRFWENYYESEEPVYSTLRSVGSRFSRLFEENEMAQCIRAMRAIDPEFRMETFQRELKEYIVPEIVDTYLSADREGLHAWFSEAMFNVAWATLGQYIKRGLVSDSKILDIREIDVSKASMGEDNTPRFIVSFSTQELFLFRRATDGVAVVGSENSVENCRYAMVLTRSEEQLDNELTGGWRVTEFFRSDKKR